MRRPGTRSARSARDGIAGGSAARPADGTFQPRLSRSDVEARVSSGHDGRVAAERGFRESRPLRGGSTKLMDGRRGDSVLVTTAKSIASVARDTDCVARYGGIGFRDRVAGSGVTRRQNILRASDRPPGEQRAYDRRHGGNRDRLSGTRHLRSGEAVSTRLASDPCRRAPGALQREIAPRSTPARRGGPGPAVKEQSSVEAGRGGRLTGLTSR